MEDEISILKEKVATANRILATEGLAIGVRSYLGHASARVRGKDLIVMKGRGFQIDALAKMRPQDMLVLDMEANVVDGPSGIIPQNEVKMHTQIYKARPDVNGVVHVHPRFCILLSLLNKPLIPMCNEGLKLVADGVPYYNNNELISTEEQGDAVAKALGNRSALILRGHGSITVGTSVELATLYMLELEEQAYMNYLALVALGPDYRGIPKEQIDAYLQFLPKMPSLPWLAKAARERGLNRPAHGTLLWHVLADKVRLEK